MNLRARLLLYGLCGVMGGLWLSMIAVLAILAAGGPALIIELAYWPSRLSGISSEHYANPDLVGPILRNVLGWTVAAELIGVAHHFLLLKVDRVPQ
jgi:hypothetical protein